MSDKIDVPVSPKNLLLELMQSASDGATLMTFLQSHLADDALGNVSPRYRLNKAQTIRRVYQLFAMISGGSVNILSNIEEGDFACCRILLTSNTKDIRDVKSVDVRLEHVFNGAIWIRLKPNGQIRSFNVLGDTLALGLSMGRRMVQGKSPA